MAQSHKTETIPSHAGCIEGRGACKVRPRDPMIGLCFRDGKSLRGLTMFL